jgi:hypothetical protein
MSFQLSCGVCDSNAGMLSEPGSVLFVRQVHGKPPIPERDRIVTMKPEAGSMGSYRSFLIRPWFIGLALLGANPMHQE